MKKSAKEIFNLMKKEGCRQITFHYDPKTNLKLIWVLDSIPDKRNKFGKLNVDVSSSGGTRFAHNDADIALEDAIKLARAMTRKAKVLGINEGGAKAVALANQEKNANFLHSIGDFIQIHKGLFRTAIDLGFILKDGKEIALKSDYVDSLSHLEKGLGSTGENTAKGIIHGYKVICKEILKKPLSECVFAIQGLGAVGMPLAKMLIKEGSKVIASDILKSNCNKAKKLGIKIVPPNELISSQVDIFSPCALGSVINNKTIPKLKCKIVAGGANNPLEDEFKHEKMLLKKNIIYVPDFILNCGGFLQALVEREGETIETARKRSIIVAKRIKQIISYSKKHNLTLLESATQLFDR
jgi:leucine dehydrogenase